MTQSVRGFTKRVYVQCENPEQILHTQLSNAVDSLSCNHMWISKVGRRAVTVKGSCICRIMKICEAGANDYDNANHDDDDDALMYSTVFENRRGK